MTTKLKLAAEDKSAIERLRSKLGNRWWRLNHLYWIANEKGEAIQFKPNKAQKDLYFSLWYLNVILKARQLGFSTFIQIFILDACLFSKNKRGGVIAHNKDDAEVLFRDKIKFAYDRLPDWIKAHVLAKNDKAGELVFSNGSSIRVATSMRSGTLQYLHVSELGKIGRKYPEKDKEIKTGSLNTVHEGGFVFFESTAEGRSGLFYETCQEAQRREQMGREPNKGEFKLHFAPWWHDTRYRTSDPVMLTAQERRYFADLRDNHAIALDPQQRAWYAQKARILGEDMRQEYPSTAQEAFEATIQGAIFGREMAKLRTERRITTVPYEPTLPVNTFWDLGRNDLTAIWFHQRVGVENRFIDYYATQFEPLSHYAKLVKDREYTYGRHYLPHDVEVTELTRADRKSRREVLHDLGIKPIVVVPRIIELREGINMAREVLPSCWFDQSKCDEGIRGLEQYEREWDERIGAFRDTPRKTEACHPADAFRQFAQGYNAPRSMGRSQRQTRAARNWRVA